MTKCQSQGTGIFFVRGVAGQAGNDEARAGNDEARAGNYEARAGNYEARAGNYVIPDLIGNLMKPKQKTRI